jgi:Ran-binding protein 1
VLQAPAAPIFGSGSALSSGGGFAGFAAAPTAHQPAASKAAAEADEGGEEGGDGEGAGEEDCSAEFKPVVQLDLVETSTGEEDEAPLTDLCAPAVPSC